MALATLIGTDLLSQWLSKVDRKAQADLEEEAYRLYGDISPPTLERMLQEKLGPSALSSIPQDFGNRNARNAALQELMGIGLAGGNDPGSLLALEEARRAGAAMDAQGRGAVRQEFQRRGLGGAGEAVLQAQAQQAGADRAAMGGLQAAADARARALQALQAGGSMAAQAEGQDFERAARVAESEDAIARFNSQLATNALQQNWQNQMGLADRRYGATKDYAGFKGGKAAETKKRVGAYGQAANEALSSMGSAVGGFGGPTMTAQPVGPSQVYDPNDPRYRRPR